jgi:UDP-N-acetylmuramoyl-L-alanyl-D-glutamate--2,6-diaminopimelate ligase
VSYKKICGANGKTIAIFGENFSILEKMLKLILGNSRNEGDGPENIDCLILTQYLKNNRDLKKILSGYKTDNPILVNGDENNILKVFENAPQVTPITYGLNKRATATAASLNIDDTLCFNYNLQRGIENYRNEVVEPFEFPKNTKLYGSQEIACQIIAAITCALFYGYDTSSIAQKISGFKEEEYYDSSSDFRAIFEKAQAMNYKNLYLLVVIDPESDREVHLKRIEAITDWAKVLDIKEVVTTFEKDCSAYINREYKKKFKNSQINHKNYFIPDNAARYIMNKISQDDKLLVIGSAELKNKENLNHIIKNC